MPGRQLTNGCPPHRSVLRPVQGKLLVQAHRRTRLFSRRGPCFISLHGKQSNGDHMTLVLSREGSVDPQPARAYGGTGLLTLPQVRFSPRFSRTGALPTPPLALVVVRPTHKSATPPCSVTASSGERRSILLLCSARSRLPDRLRTSGAHASFSLSPRHYVRTERIPPTVSERPSHYLQTTILISNPPFTLPKTRDACQGAGRVFDPSAN